VGNTLRDVDRLLKGPNGDKINSSHNISRALEDCWRQLNDLTAKLEPGPSWKRLVWPLKKEEVAAITEKLGRYRSTMSFDLQIYQAYVSNLGHVNCRSFLEVRHLLAFIRSSYWRNYAQ
jgi:hypothetical protein